MQFFSKSIPLFFLCALGCLSTPLQALEVWVSILPQKYFVERVGGDSVSVEVLVRPGQSPELYAPGAAQLARLARAAAYVGIGVPVENKVISRIEASMPGVRILQTGELVAGGHEHDAHGNCLHGDQDPHTWMDPVQMISAVERIRDLLSELDPAQETFFADNAALLIGELRLLDTEIQGQLAPYAGRAFYINHPSLGHFAERYGLRQLSIEQAGSAPSARRVVDLVKAAKAEQVGAIFTQPEFGRTSATVLAKALGVEVVEINPLAEDYLVNMRKIAGSLERSFTK